MFSEARNTMWSQKIKYWQDKGCWCEISAPFSCPKRHRESYGVFTFHQVHGKLYWKGWEIEGISSCRKCKSSVHRFSHMEKQVGTELNFFRKRTLFQTAGGRWDYGGISHWENPRLHGDGKPSSAEHGTVAESEGAAVPHAILAGGLGLYHQRSCADMPGLIFFAGMEWTAFVLRSGSWRMRDTLSVKESATPTGGSAASSTRFWSSPGRRNLNRENLNGKIQFR